MRIGDFDLARRVLVVAEIGNNHEGDVAVARELVRRAGACGADAVKFQTIDPERLVRPSERERLAQLTSFALSHDAFRELADLAHGLGLLFLSTPFDLDSAAFVGAIADAVKIASGDNDFFPLLAAVAATHRPVLLSAGMADLEGVRAGKACLERAWARDGVDPPLAVLHCVSAYPSAPEDANLLAIPLLERELGCTIGYSDHTTGIDAAVAAVALGARVVEKHFTLDHAFSSFRDHELSAEPAELAELIRRVRSTELLRGRPEKSVQDAERPVAAAARRSIVAAADLPQGHVVRLEDLTWLRPRDGLPPGAEDRLVGRRLRRAVAFGETILTADVEGKAG